MSLTKWLDKLLKIIENDVSKISDQKVKKNTNNKGQNEYKENQINGRKGIFVFTSKFVKH